MYTIGERISIYLLIFIISVIRAAELLGGKGNGKGNRFQAKVSNMSQRDRVVKLIEEKLE